MINKLDMPLQIKTVGENGEFEGYGSVFGVKDSYDDIVIKGAFSKSLGDWRAKGRMPSLLWQHDTTEPIGVYTEISEDDSGLRVAGRLLINDDPLAKRAYAHLKAGSISGLSIGYKLNDYEYDPKSDAFILKDIDLYEISLVTFPANDAARISTVKSMIKSGEFIQPKILERVLRDAGLSRTQSKAFMAEGYAALKQRDAGGDNDALNILKSIF